MTTINWDRLCPGDLWVSCDIGARDESVYLQQFRTSLELINHRANKPALRRRVGFLEGMRFDLDGAPTDEWFYALDAVGSEPVGLASSVMDSKGHRADAYGPTTLTHHSLLGSEDHFPHWCDDCGGSVTQLVLLGLAQVQPGGRGYQLGKFLIANTLRLLVQGHSNLTTVALLAGSVDPWNDNNPAPGSPEGKAAAGRLAKYWATLGFDPHPDNPHTLTRTLGRDEVTELYDTVYDEVNHAFAVEELSFSKLWRSLEANF